MCLPNRLSTVIFSFLFPLHSISISSCNPHFVFFTFPFSNVLLPRDYFFLSSQCTYIVIVSQNMSDRCKVAANASVYGVKVVPCLPHFQPLRRTEFIQGCWSCVRVPELMCYSLCKVNCPKAPMLLHNTDIMSWISATLSPLVRLCTERAKDTPPAEEAVV